MNPVDIHAAESGLNAFQRFLTLFSSYDQHRLSARLEAVQAIGTAAAETRAWTETLRQRDDGEEVVDRSSEISDLWHRASEKIARFDTKLAYECMVKAYGWRTGKWNNPEYAIIPRRVEEIHAQAMELIHEYQPMLGKGTR